MAASVFAATDVGRVLRIDKRDIDICLRFGGWCGRSGDGGRDFVAVHHGPRDRQLDLWIQCCMLDGLERVRRVVAGELGGPIDDHLWSVDVLHLQTLTVFSLPVGVLMGRKPVKPAFFVPIVNVLAQHDDLGAVDGLFLLELRQKSVRWRAARATLRGEQLYQYWCS